MQSEDAEPLIASKARCKRWQAIVGVGLVVVLGVVSIIIATTHSRSNPPVPLPSDPMQRALALMHSNVLWDGHNDLPWAYRKMANNQVDEPSLFDLRQNLSEYTETDLPRLRIGRLMAQFWSVYVGCTKQDKDAVRATMEQVDTVHRLARRYSDSLQLCFEATCVQSSFASGKIASFIAIEGGHSIDSSLAALRMFFRQGVRVMGLTHNCNTPWADSCAVNATHGGLTDFGKQVVLEMNRLGMLVDLSHAHELTMHATLDLGAGPVIFTHSNARSLCDHPRNVPDSVLDKLNRSDAVVMINFVSPFINCASPTSASIEDVVQHISYIAHRIGSKHVGIGADFDGNATLVGGLQDVSRYPELIAALIRKGFSDSEVIGFMGANILRVLGVAEDYALGLSHLAPLQSIISPDTPEIANNSCRTPSDV